MKQFAIILLCSFMAVLPSCKDEAEPTPTTDLRDNIIGEYNTKLTVYNAKTLEKRPSGDYAFILKVQKKTGSTTKIDFYIDGLDLFMTAENTRTISVGTAFDIPQQEVKSFGTLTGKNYINVAGETARFTGIRYDANKKITIYMEKDNGGSADDDLYEFFLTPKA